MKLSAQFKNAKEQSDYCLAMRKHIGVLDRPLRKCADVYYAMWNAQFAAGGSYGSVGPWAPLKESTKRQRTKAGYGTGPILWRTGALMTSWTSPRSSAHLQRVGPTYIEFGSIMQTPGGAWYLSAIHHYGAKGRTIPARSMVGVEWNLPPAEQILTDSIKNDFINQWYDAHG